MTSTPTVGEVKWLLEEECGKGTAYARADARPALAIGAEALGIASALRAPSGVPIIKVAVIEDDPEIRHRLIDIIEAADSLMLVGAAGTAKGGYALADRKEAEVYLVDLGLPDENGIGLVRYISERLPQANSMVITVFGDDDHIIRSIEAGATGYLLKDAMPREIIDCIRDLHAGGSPVSPVIARRLLRLFRPVSEPFILSKGTKATSFFSNRELEILTLVAKGLSFTEICEILSISYGTTTCHMRKVYKKLKVHSRGEAVFEAKQRGLLR